jgi:hypothetical protein
MQSQGKISPYERPGDISNIAAKVDVFQQTLERFNVSQPEQDELITIESAITQAILRADRYLPIIKNSCIFDISNILC